MKEMVICKYKSNEAIIKFTYEEGVVKPYRFKFNDAFIRCDEKSFSELIEIVINNIENINKKEIDNNEFVE